MLAEGADILDIGGESTRPGAPQVDADGEWARIADVLRAAGMGLAVLHGSRARFGVVRINRDLFREATAGFLFTAATDYVGAWMATLMGWLRGSGPPS